MDSVESDGTRQAGDGPGRLQRALGDAYAVEAEIGRGGMATVYRGAAGTERIVPLPDSLGAFMRLWGADADGGGAYLVAAPAAAGVPARIRIVRVDRASGALTRVVDLPAAQFPHPLAVAHGAVTYATWLRGRATIWRVRPDRAAAKVAVLPVACDEETLAMSADGRRFVCAQRATRPDLFLLEGFDRYRR